MVKFKNGDRYYYGDNVYRVKKMNHVAFCSECDLPLYVCRELNRPCSNHDYLFCVLKLVK